MNAWLKWIRRVFLRRPPADVSCLICGDRTIGQLNGSASVDYVCDGLHVGSAPVRPFTLLICQDCWRAFEAEGRGSEVVRAEIQRQVTEVVH